MPVVVMLSLYLSDPPAIVAMLNRIVLLWHWDSRGRMALVGRIRIRREKLIQKYCLQLFSCSEKSAGLPVLSHISFFDFCTSYTLV